VLFMTAAQVNSITEKAQARRFQEYKPPEEEI
jgi:hypothetical protein